MEKLKVQTIPEQINEALDGRTQRWLSFKVEIPESDLSRKMNGHQEFTEEEIANINEALNSEIKLKTGK